MNRGNSVPKSPPSRRTETESWADDDSIGGIVWKEDESDDTSPIGHKLLFPKGNNWKTGGWKVSPSENHQPTAAPWKTSAPPKSSNLVNAIWKGGNPLDSAVVPWDHVQWPGMNPDPTLIFQGCKMTLKCGSNNEITTNYQSTLSDTSADDTMTTTTTAAPITTIGWPPKQNLGKSWKPPSKTWRPPKWKKPTPAPTPPETMSSIMMWKPSPKPKINWKKPPPNMWKQPPTTMMWTETTPHPFTEMTWKPSPAPMKWKKAPKPTKSWKPPPTKSWKPPPTKSWKPPKMPVKTWPSPIATPRPDMWPTTKPDCKDTTHPTETPHQHAEDHDLMEPPQIIIITKLPKNSPPGPSDKKDKDGGKHSLGPWIFPPRKHKSSKHRKDKHIPIESVKWQPNRPLRNSYKHPNINKGWPKGIPPTKYSWPSNTMRRWTTKKPTSISTWKSKYSKSRSWRQMLKKWMSGL